MARISNSEYGAVGLSILSSLPAGESSAKRNTRPLLTVSRIAERTFIGRYATESNEEVSRFCHVNGVQVDSMRIMLPFFH